MKKIAVTVAATIASMGIWTSAASAEEVVVQKGDNLWSLARSHQTTVDNLLTFNNLTSDVIHPGQVLQTKYIHTVTKGESLWRIARQYGTTVHELKASNDLTTDLITIGQVLTIPGVDAADVAATHSSVGSSNGKPMKYETSNKQVKREQSHQLEKQAEAVNSTSEKASAESKQEEVQVKATNDTPEENSARATDGKDTEISTEKTNVQASEEESAKNPDSTITNEQTEAQATKPEKPEEEDQTKVVANQKEQPVNSKETDKVRKDPVKKEATQQKETSVKTIKVTSTAYTVKSAGGSGVTATGINLKKNPKVKVISVDPKVIPLGTKVYVEGYGHAIAGDTGGAIKGKKIDIYFPTEKQARNWGVRTVEVKIEK